MKKIAKPSISTAKIVRRCSKNYRDKDKIARFGKSASAIEAYSNNCAAYMQNYDLESINNETIVFPVTNDEMKSLYTDKFAKAGSPGRMYYDKIMVSSPNNKCTYCDASPPSSLDHFLPKSKYPYLAVSPENLFPCCDRCNKAKLEIFINKRGILLPHPLYPVGEESIWLFADVSFEDNPPYVTYRIESSGELASQQVEQLQLHFETFELYKRYSELGSSKLMELKNLIPSLVEFHEGSSSVFSSNIVRDLLDIFRKSCEPDDLNNWESALYRALSNSDEFIRWIQV